MEALDLQEDCKHSNRDKQMSIGRKKFNMDPKKGKRPNFNPFLCVCVYRIVLVDCVRKLMWQTKCAVLNVKVQITTQLYEFCGTRAHANTFFSGHNVQRKKTFFPSVNF